MKRSTFLLSVLAPVLWFSAPQTANAYIQHDTSGAKYMFSERRIMQFDDFTTASGSTTFDRRRAYLRSTQYQRIQEDLKKQEFGSTPARSRPVYLTPQGTGRARDTVLRRLQEAENQFRGTRLRSSIRANQRNVTTSIETRKQRVQDMRDRMRESYSRDASPIRTSVDACYSFTRRRLAQCLYELRTD